MTLTNSATNSSRNKVEDPQHHQTTREIFDPVGDIHAEAELLNPGQLRQGHHFADSLQVALIWKLKSLALVIFLSKAQKLCWAFLRPENVNSQLVSLWQAY